MRKRLRKKLETRALVFEKPPRRSRLVYYYGLRRINGFEVPVYTAKPHRHSEYCPGSISVEWDCVAKVRELSHF
jgi:hypothetical protein